MSFYRKQTIFNSNHTFRRSKNMIKLGSLKTYKKVGHKAIEATLVGHP